MFKNISLTLSWIIFGLLSAIIIYTAYNIIVEQIYLLTPVTNIFEQSIIVPDFYVDDDPVLQYTKIINDNLIIIYDATIHDLSTDQVICEQRGENVFNENKIFTPKITTLELFMNDKCIGLIKSGQYYIEVTNIIKKDKYPDRLYNVRSNVFKVT